MALHYHILKQSRLRDRRTHRLGPCQIVAHSHSVRNCHQLHRRYDGRLCNGAASGDHCHWHEHAGMAHYATTERAIANLRDQYEAQVAAEAATTATKTGGMR